MRLLIALCAVPLSVAAGCRAARPAGDGFRAAEGGVGQADRGSEERRGDFARHRPEPPPPFDPTPAEGRPHPLRRLVAARGVGESGAPAAVGPSIQVGDVLFVPQLVYVAYVRNPTAARGSTGAPPVSGLPCPPAPSPPALGGQPGGAAVPEPPPPAIPLPSIPVVPVPGKGPPAITPRVIRGPGLPAIDLTRHVVEPGVGADDRAERPDGSGKPDVRS